MAQFTKYFSSDPYGPGPLYGAVGSLLTVLDACLVNGYTGKAAAGWTKPVVNSGNIGCYKMGAGTGFSLVINDNGPNGTSTYKEAWMTGWKTVTSVAASYGEGTGQFPSPGMVSGVAGGKVVFRKSASADATTPRHWIIFADNRTFYAFVFSGDNPDACGCFGFGDIRSYHPGDLGCCFIAGNSNENGSAVGASPYNALGWASNLGATRINAGNGMYIASGVCGMSRPTAAGVIGDAATGNVSGEYSSGLWTPGSLQGGHTFNRIELSEHPDASVSYSNGHLRGYFRGLWAPACSPALFGVGQLTTGTGVLAGRTFYAIRGSNNSAITNAMQVEISNTLD